MRWMFRLFALYFVALVAAPGVLYMEFQARRAYIERELCVQRDVMEGMRTCHGDCYFSKQYRALEQEAEKGFPTERMVRFEPVTDLVQDAPVWCVPVCTLERVDPRGVLLEGVAQRVDHVPKA